MTWINGNNSYSFAKNVEDSNIEVELLIYGGDNMPNSNRRFMKEKEAKKFLSEFREIMNLDSPKLLTLKPPIELAKINDEEIFFVGGKPIFARLHKRFFPTLESHDFLTSMPKATVNMGAVPFICNGADVMAPGIVRFEGIFNEEDLVLVIDELHRKSIAITVALYNVENAKTLKRGKILKNLHYIGDRLWKAIKQLS